MADSNDELLAEEFDRVAVLDAAFDLARQLRRKGAIYEILGQARDDARAAVRDLVRCDPHDAAKVRDLQWQVSRFGALCDYVGNILEAGKVASEDLTAEQLAETERLLRGGKAQPKD